MAIPPDAPCEPWTSIEEIEACCDGLDPDSDYDNVLAAIQFSSAILYRLSGRQFPGECIRTIYPCYGDNSGCGCTEWQVYTAADWWAPNIYPTWPVPGVNGGWLNIGDCCNSCNLSSVELPSTVNEIFEIGIEGEVLDPGAYMIQAYRRVVRTDGGKWPCTNNMTDPEGLGWYITYGYGKPVPADGRMAASIFACQIAKNRCGSDDCVLPQRLKTITRQGVEMAFADPLEFLDNGKTGLYEVDLWLASVNPSKLKRRARVHRPDKPRNNRTITGSGSGSS